MIPPIHQPMRVSTNYHRCYPSVIICSVYPALNIKFSFWSPYHYIASTAAFPFIHQTRWTKLIRNPVLYTHHNIMCIAVAKAKPHRSTYLRCVFRRIVLVAFRSFVLSNSSSDCYISYNNNVLLHYEGISVIFCTFLYHDVISIISQHTVSVRIILDEFQNVWNSTKTSGKNVYIIFYVYFWFLLNSLPYT